MSTPATNEALVFPYHNITTLANGAAWSVGVSYVHKY